MFAEDDLLPIAALQHLFFCERQCALIHLEQAWSENRLTAEGRILHERAHEGGSESRGDVRIERGLMLRSLRLGLFGKADIVEFHRSASHTENELGARPWMPFPVEYKRGKPKRGRYDEVQLCAQALCLEEMLGCSIPAGAIFYGEPRRRMDVILDASLRDETERTVQRLRALLDAGITPTVKYGKHCRSCSLLDKCMPKLGAKRQSVQQYIEEATADLDL